MAAAQGTARCPFCSHTQPVSARRGAALCDECQMYFPVGPPLHGTFRDDGSAATSEAGEMQTARRRELPPDWEQYWDEDGSPYFHSIKTGITQWEHPMDSLQAEESEQARKQQLAEQKWMRQQQEASVSHERRLEKLGRALRNAQIDSERAETELMQQIEAEMVERDELEHELHRLERETEQAHYQLKMLQRAVAGQRLLPRTASRSSQRTTSSGSESLAASAEPDDALDSGYTNVLTMDRQAVHMMIQRRAGPIAAASGSHSATVREGAPPARVRADAAAYTGAAAATHSDTKLPALPRRATGRRE